MSADVPNDPFREGLVLLCGALGRTTSVPELGDGMPLDHGRLDAALAPRALRRLDINARVTPYPLAAMEPMLLPALLLLGDGRAVVLTAIEGEDAHILLPAAAGGGQVVPLAQLEALYSGTAVFAKARYRGDARTGSFAAAEGEHWFYGALKRLRRSYLEVGVAAFTANLLAIGSALFAMQVYDRVVPTGALDTLWILASGVILAIILDGTLRIMRAHLLDTMGKGLDLRLSALLFERVLGTRLAAKPPSLGAFSTQVREFEGVREFFTASSAAAISDLPFVLIFLAIIALIGGVVVWVPVVGIVLMIVPGLLAQKRLAALSRQNLREGAVKNSILLESFEHLETIKATRSEGRAVQMWEVLTAQLAGSAMQSHKLSSALAHGAGMVQQLCYVGVVVFGVYRIGMGEMTVGSVVASTLLSSRAVAPMSQFAAILARWQHTKVAMEGLDQLMSAPSERPAGRQFARKPKLTGHYVMEGLQLRHGEGAPVVDITALEIKPGERVALLGGNGAGKSSLLRLMSGLGDPTGGRLLLDDVGLLQIDPADRRRAIGYLPQDIALLQGTLRDNLNLEGAALGDDELFDALDQVGMGAFVRGHPLGLDLPIAGSGSFSGGQRQAVGLARILLQDPSILLLDEPTAALDNASETQVMRHLADLLGSRTVIFSTHKKSLLALATRALVLRGGQVIMDGPTDKIVSGNQVLAPPPAAAAAAAGGTADAR